MEKIFCQVCGVYAWRETRLVNVTLMYMEMGGGGEGTVQGAPRIRRTDSSAIV